MKKIWCLIIGILLANMVFFNFIDNTDLSKIYGIPVSNWIYRLYFSILSISLLMIYYKANWGKSRIK
jgi:hypothetical protein